METKTGAFQESPGVTSITRILVAALIGYAIFSSGIVLGAGLFMYVKHNGNDSLMGIVAAAVAMLTGISTFAAGWKLIQKPMENKPDKPE